MSGAFIFGEGTVVSLAERTRAVLICLSCKAILARSKPASSFHMAAYYLGNQGVGVIKEHARKCEAGAFDVAEWPVEDPSLPSDPSAPKDPK